MSAISIAYASPSSLESTAERTSLGLAANALRPVHFHGVVKPESAFLLRVALRALGQAIWSADTWESDDDFRGRVLDPVITVHPDRLWFEAFTNDRGAYLSLQADPALFESQGEARFGTTNVDFTAWLWGQLGELRSSRRTALKVGAEGFELATDGAGGRFEQKVDLPDAWLRAFLQTQAAMALPGTRLRLRPVDLLGAIRFLQKNKAKVSPRALRWVFEPGQPAALVLEPWEQRIELVGAEHGRVEPHAIRTWGRRKLALLEPLLPFATQVDVYLKGRGLPSFFAVHLPGLRFVLGITGTGAGSGFDAGFDLLAGLRQADEGVQARVLAELAERFHASAEQLAEACALPLAEVAQALSALTRAGRAMFDVEARTWRHRELFAPPLDLGALFPPDPRREAALALLSDVRELSAEPEVQTKLRKFRDPSSGAAIERSTPFKQWKLRARVGGEQPEIRVSEEERIIFGQCGCAHFKTHLLSQGPCEHMLALFEAGAQARR
jgi:hypothetical protein